MLLPPLHTQWRLTQKCASFFFFFLAKPHQFGNRIISRTPQSDRQNKGLLYQWWKQNIYHINIQIYIMILQLYHFSTISNTQPNIWFIWLFHSGRSHHISLNFFPFSISDKTHVSFYENSQISFAPSMYYLSLSLSIALSLKLGLNL